MRLFYMSLLAAMLFNVQAQAQGPVLIETKQPFESYVVKLKAAISANKMGLVSEACATCGAKSIGVEIAGNRIFMVFNPHFAVRMLEANLEAGVEAPLRLYITQNADGTARLSYRTASDVFAPYGTKALDEMAVELDVILNKIARDSL